MTTIIIVEVRGKRFQLSDDGFQPKDILSLIFKKIQASAYMIELFVKS